MSAILDIAASVTVTERHPAPVRRARIGLLGCGTIGRAVVAAITEHPHLNLDCIGAFVRDAADARSRNVGTTLVTDPSLVIDTADVVDIVNLTLVSFSHTDTDVIVRVSDGAIDTIGEFTVRANVSNGQVFDQTVKIKIRKK